MNRQNSRLQRNGSAMELELSRQGSSSADNSEPHIDPRFSGLQITRDNKRTSERQEIAEMRRQSRLSDTSSNLQVQSDTIPEEREAPERQDSSDSDAQLQLLSPHRSDPTTTYSQAEPQEFSNWIESLGTHNEQPTRPENSQMPHLNPFAFLSGLLGGISRAPRTNQDANTASPQQVFNEHPHPSNDNLPENGNENLNPFENNIGEFPHGALIVRTVQPGPNGSIIIRMRVLSLDELLGRQEGTTGNQPVQPGQSGPEGLGIFGALLGMLSGFHEMEERGLDKETLDSLPFVTYNKEMFKNVEAESKSCPICLEEFEDGNEVRFLWCIHRFHKNCVDQWLDKHTSCPICKKDYSEAEKNFE